MKNEYFGFKLSEYKYKRVSFNVSRSRESAEKKNRVHFVNYKSPVSHDLSVEIIHGFDKFINWCDECDYVIDWENKAIVHKDDASYERVKRREARALSEIRSTAGPVNGNKGNDMVKKTSAAKRKELVNPDEMVLINVKISRGLKRKLQKKANEFTKGNLSDFLRQAGLAFTPEKPNDDFY